MNHVLRCHDIVKSDFVRARGCTLTDSSGREYLDFESGIWSTALGHAHPRVDRAMHAQIERVVHLGTRYPSPLAEEAALDVLDAVGIEDGKCVFLSSGSEAVELAVQAARRVTGRPLLLAFESSYFAAYGSAGAKSPDEWVLLDPGADESALDAIPFDRVAAFAFEPGGSGIAFVRFPRAELVAQVERRVREAGGLLVANEVTTGMGRTGTWFGFQHYGFRPDAVALGKGLGNGYPVSAVAFRRPFAEGLEATGLRYAQSHQNDPLGCAVVREVLATFRDEGWVEKGRETGAFFLRELQRLARARPDRVREARGRGMLLALELRGAPGPGAEEVSAMLRERGFLVGCYAQGNVLRFSPALTMAREDVLRLVAALDEILAPAEKRAAD